jgi:DCN1-like protein 4/5
VLPATATGSTGSVNKAAVRELEKIDAFFSQYADKFDETSIGPDGIEALCQDLGVSPTDIRVLLLAWKLQASRQGYFSLDEWRRGMKAMRVDSVDKLKKALPGLQQEVNSQYLFKDFYVFAFQYCLTEPRQKTLDLESACQMLELVLGPRAHVPSFLQFLQEQTEYKAMNMDQWTAFLRFCEEVEVLNQPIWKAAIDNSAFVMVCEDELLHTFLVCDICGILHCFVQIKPDLTNYDESQAWPLLLDNYVEWARKYTMISL